MRRLFALLVVAAALFGVLVLIGIFASGSSTPTAAGCIPSSALIRQDQATKPGGQTFRPPYGNRHEVGYIRTQEINWVRMHPGDACVKAMADHVKVKVTALPAWLQKASLQKVGHDLIWFYGGKPVFNLNGSVYAPPKGKKAAATASSQCASTVHYFVLANHNFGPPLKGSTPKARLQDLQSRYTACEGDSLLTADNARAMKLPGYAGLTNTQVRAAAQRLVAHPDDWRKLVKVLDAKENKDFRSDVLLTGEYRTGYMVRHSGMPLLYSAQLSSTERSLRFQVGSSTVYIQEPCGGQPRVQVPTPVQTVTVVARPPTRIVTVVYRHPSPTCKVGKMVNGKCVTPPSPPTCKTGTMVHGKCVTPPPHHNPPPKCIGAKCGPPPSCTGTQCGNQPPQCTGKKCGNQPPKCTGPQCGTQPPPSCTGSECSPPPSCTGPQCGNQPPPPCSTCTSKTPPPVQDPQSPSQAYDGPTQGAPLQAPAPNPVVATSGSHTYQAPNPAPDNGPGKTSGYAGTGTGTSGTTPGGSTTLPGGTITAQGGASATSNPTTGITGTYSGSPSGPPS